MSSGRTWEEGGGGGEEEGEKMNLDSVLVEGEGLSGDWVKVTHSLGKRVFGLIFGRG